MEECVFLNEGSVYVSNTRVVIAGTTYSTANVTSVRKTVTPAQTGCASVLAIFSALAFFGGLIGTLSSSDHGDGATAMVLGGIFFIIFILFIRSQKATYHVMLASASGERQGLTSQDEGLVNRATTAIAEAITYRG
ncbi:MAG TPA: DUF6232 family protein [Thermoanaerobaculia bacterium]|nr:DUF6232 family protein [Thermoanaerobaculia bacterium]